MADINTGSISALDGIIEATNISNFGTAGVVVTGTWVGTLTFSASLDGINFVNILAQQLDNGNLVNTTSSNNSYLVNLPGLQTLRIQMTAYTSGTANITIQGTSPIAANNTLATIRGNNDGTKIGNVGDRLKIDAVINNPSGSGLGSLTISKKLRLDRNFTQQTVNNTYSTIYSYSGSGLFFGFHVDTDNANLEVRLTLDFDVIFEDLSVSDLNLLDWNMGFGAFQDGQFFNSGTGGDFDFSPRYPIPYTSNITIEAKRRTSGTAKVRAVGVILTKET
jgi:hypothetical protein